MLHQFKTDTYIGDQVQVLCLAGASYIYSITQISNHNFGIWTTINIDRDLKDELFLSAKEIKTVYTSDVGTHFKINS